MRGKCRNEIPEGQRMLLSAPCLRAEREIPARRFDSFRDDLFGQGPSSRIYARGLTPAREIGLPEACFSRW